MSYYTDATILSVIKNGRYPEADGGYALSLLHEWAHVIALRHA